MPLIGVLAALITVTLWGMNFIAVKVAITDVPPLFVSGMRFVILTILLSPFLKIPKGHFRGILEYAMIMGIGHFCVMFVSLQFIEISTGGIVLQLGTPFIVLLAWLMLKERFGIWRFAGMLMAFSGIGVLIGFPGSDIDPLWLFGLVFAAFMWALSSIRAKQLAGGVQPFTLIAWMALLASPFVFLLSWIFESGQVAAVMNAEWRFWASLAYMIVASSIIGYGLWYWLIQRYDVSAVAPYNLLVPLVAAAGGIYVLGDVMTPIKLFGGAMIFAGVSLITIRQIYLARRAYHLVQPKV